ncbi:MAG: radical SAM protein [Candidatus Promineifilaceae bacterium]
MANVLLCNPLFLNQSEEERASGSPYFPLGLLYLAAYIRERGHQVAVFDGTFAGEEADFIQALKEIRPDVVGITALMPIKSAALRLAQLAKEAGKTVFLGGPDPTYDPKAYLEHAQVDIVVHHEGEITLVVLLDLLEKGRLTADSLAGEPGVAFRDKNGRPVVNQPRPYIEDLDSLPFPARDLIDMEKYLDTWREQNGYSSLTLATSRGCPYGCEWCQDAVHGQALRQRSPENVVAELKQLKATYEIDRLRVVDDVDGIDRSWLEEWAKTAEAQEAVIPFEALSDLHRQDIPMLDVRDSL